MIKVSNDLRVDKQIRALPFKENARIVSVIEFFATYGFNVREPYLKKLTANLWELRAGRFRLLFGLAQRQAVIVNMFLKKTQKTPRKEIELAQKRLKDYL